MREEEKKKKKKEEKVEEEGQTPKIQRGGEEKTKTRLPAT